MIFAFVLAIAFASYLLGSIPFGLLLTRIAGLGDVRSIGSGNIGATNVLRTGKKSLALLTLILDAGKGCFAVLLTEYFFHDQALTIGDFSVSFVSVAGLFAFLGHLYPCWLNFKGGKGVATLLGVVSALAWPVACAAMLIWLLTAIVFRYSSLAALVATLSTPLLAFFMGHQDLMSVLVLFVVFVFFKHKANIMRLFNGLEPKVGKKEVL